MRPRARTAWILSAISLVMAAIIVFWWWAHGPERFVRDTVGLDPQALAVPWAWALASAVAVVHVSYTYFAVPFVKKHRFDLDALKALGVVLALLSGVVEEVVFRAMLMDAAQSWGLAPGWQILLSAAVFSSAHVVWMFFGGEVRIVFPAAGATFVLGLMLALVYVVADRNILPAIAAHTAVNLAIEPWLMLAAVSGAWKDGRNV